MEFLLLLKFNKEYLWASNTFITQHNEVFRKKQKNFSYTFKQNKNQGKNDTPEIEQRDD